MLNSDGTEIVGVDLADLIRPVEVSAVDVPDSHDVFARGDTLYVAEGRAPTFSIWDVSDKAAPRQIGKVTVPSSGYVHNIGRRRRPARDDDRGDGRQDGQGLGHLRPR